MDVRTALPSAVAVGAVLGAAIAALAPPDAAPAAPHAITAAIEAVKPVEWDIPIVRNEYVQRFVDMFQDKQADRMALYLKRSGRYEGMIRGKLRAKGMPEDLVYLSMIESGFNPNARSTAQAVGLWQFMAATGRLYGLRIDSYVDERRHPERSTDAALRYLEDLYAQFGSWNLAAAAYNSGENRVARLMKEETGTVKGDEADFWRIRNRLPRETREYVPLIFAAALIGKEPGKYGMERVERWLPLAVEQVQVPGGTSLDVVAKSIGMKGLELRELNPHLIKGTTPPGGSYPVRIPQGRAEQFAMSFKAPQAAARPSASGSSTHRVVRGESLSTIAQRHGVSVAALQRANNMGRRTVIQPGQLLKVPV